MKFTIKDRITTAEPNAVLSYALDYRAEFEVDDEWTDKVVTARFVHSNGEYIDVVLDNFGCNIPLFPKGVLWVGAYTDAFTSTAVPVPIGVTIKDLGEHEAIPPTADVYQQIIALIEAGRLKGDKGDPGEDYVITEADYQAIADRVPQPDLSDYVKNTDYATASKGGVVRTGYGLSIESNGVVNCSYARTPQQYENYSNYNFISKGTLENVLAERMKEPQFELIEEITTTEVLTSFERATEPNGTPYNLDAIYLYIKWNGEKTTSSASCTFVTYHNSAYLSWDFFSFEKGNNPMIKYFVANNKGFLDAYGYSNLNGEMANQQRRMSNFNNQMFASVTKVSVQNIPNLPIGSNIKIYGIRA